MAGSASNWYKPTSGSLAGQAVYISKAQRTQANGKVLSYDQVLAGLNGDKKRMLSRAAKSQRPAGVARSGAGTATPQAASASLATPKPTGDTARTALDLVKTKRKIDQEYSAIVQANASHADIANITSQIKDRERKMRGLGFAPGGADRLEAVRSEVASLRQDLQKVAGGLASGDQARRLQELTGQRDALAGQLDRKPMRSLGTKKAHEENSYITDTYDTDRLTDYQSDAMDEYIENSFQINNGLRTGKLKNSPPMAGTRDKPRDVREDVESLDEMVQTVPKGGELTMFRGLDARLLGDLKPGTELHDKAFMSLGFNEDLTREYAMAGLEGVDAKVAADRERVPAIMRVHLTEGTRVVPAITHVRGKAEAHNEMLMDRGTTMRVTGVSEQDGILVIDTEVASQRS